MYEKKSVDSQLFQNKFLNKANGAVIGGKKRVFRQEGIHFFDEGISLEIELVADDG